MGTLPDRGREANSDPVAHTPGPWTLKRTIVRAESGEPIALVHMQPEGFAKVLGNGRLIAAAPKLLESLEEMEDMFARRMNDEPGPDDAAQRWDRARAAIAQAKGGAQ